MKHIQSIVGKNLLLILAVVSCLCLVSWDNPSLNAKEGRTVPTAETETTVEDGVASSSARAMLCNTCSFGTRKDYCVKCGQWMANSRAPAYLCSSCGFGTQKDDCVKCGQWIGSGGSPAFICSSCGFGTKKDDCVKCGRWRGGN